MKAFLMFQDRDWDANAILPPQSGNLIQDLELERLLKEMSGDDTFLFEMARTTLLTSLHCPIEIAYRQGVLQDCLAHGQTIRSIYSLAVEAIEREKRVWGSLFNRYPDGLLRRSLEVLEIFVGLLKRLKNIGEREGQKFESSGFHRFFAMLAAGLNDGYIAETKDHLGRLRFTDGLRISAELGSGNKGKDYILRMPREIRHGWAERLRRWIEKWSFGNSGRRLYYQIAERDESGARMLSELKGLGISQVAISLGQSADHILSFFKMLRSELGFYICCLNLRDRLIAKGEPICFPEAEANGRAFLFADGLYDVCLSLSMTERVVGNDVHAHDKPLVMITGANRGGKSTLLRSIGVAQMMMQCGMFVPALRLRMSLCRGIFTHFRREEDASMKSGKFEEELSRMSCIVKLISPGSLVLLNESFASTNEREGSEIARGIVRALLDSGVKVCYVTHMFDLAESFRCSAQSRAIFLRAERLGSGARTFRLAEASPLPTSFGQDLYHSIFEQA